MESWSEVFSSALLFNLWHYFICHFILTLEYKHIMYQKDGVILKVLVVLFSEEKTIVLIKSLWLNNGRM